DQGSGNLTLNHSAVETGAKKIRSTNHRFGHNRDHVAGSVLRDHTLTASTIDSGPSVAMTRERRNPARRSRIAYSAFVLSRPRGVSTSISKSSSLPSCGAFPGGTDRKS